MDLVEHVTTKRVKAGGLDAKVRCVSEGTDQSEVEEAISNGSLEMAEDNYIPEVGLLMFLCPHCLSSLFC